MTDTKDMPEPVAWASFGDRGNIRMWSASHDIEQLRALNPEPIYSSATVTALMERVEKAETAERERELYRAALQDDERPMESDSDEMTAAESVLAYLYVEIVGAPDDEAVSPLKAQKAIEAKLSSAERDRDAAIARAERAERLLAEARKALEPFAQFPLHGIYGGPLCIVKGIYEDGTDENTARHRGLIAPSHLRDARAIVDKEDGFISPAIVNKEVGE